MIGNCEADFKLLQNRWRDSITGAEADFNSPHVKNACQLLRLRVLDYWRSMNRESTRSCLWRDLPDPGNPYMRDRICLATCRRLEAMALAWCTSGCLTEELIQEELNLFLSDILDALEFIYQNWYNEKSRKGGEWWHKEIGMPLSLNSCILLLYEHLGETRNDYIRAIESYTNTPEMMCIEDTPEVSTGANRAWKCLALAQCGILKKDDRLLSISSEKIRDVFQYTETGDGFYRDGSFVQHLKFAYTGGYGVSFLDTIVSYMELTKGTPWSIRDQERAMVLDWVKNSYEPLIYKGGFMSMARGREIARKESEEHIIGHSVIRSLLKLSNALEDKEAIPLKRKIKHWITEDTYRCFLSFAPMDSLSLAKKVLDDPQIGSMEFPDSCKVFAAMDKVVHHRGSFAAGISMSSERIGRYESIHGENVRGWYTSEGMLYLYNSDLEQFSEDYFPTVNAYRLPGTTVDTCVRKEVGIGFGKEPALHTSWAGGCCLNDLYGAVGMELEAECSDLRAKKSWFLFDEEIVCLGAGIHCTQGRSVETTVENRKVAREAAGCMTADGDIVFSGEKVVLHGIKHIHLKGSVPGSDIGYYFPVSQRIELSEEERTDSWKGINQLSTISREFTNRYVNIVIHHGIDPVDAQYAYVILPGKTGEQMRRYAENPQIEVIRNSKFVQAVKHKKLNLLGINSWTDTGCSVEGIFCNGKASLMLREDGDKLMLTAADPTWKNTQGITIELDRKVSGVLYCDKEISVERVEPSVILTIDTGNAQGKSFGITFLK